MFQFDAAKVKILEQNYRIAEIESQLTSQAITIKILQAEKEHSLILTHHTTPELTNQLSRMQMHQSSAESARKPKYKISDLKARMVASGRPINSEFSIVLPSQNSEHGNMDILNLEEQPETGVSHQTHSLGPMVVTDDEYAIGQEMEKAAVKQPRVQRWRRGHRRTASTGSSNIPLSKRKDGEMKLTSTLKSVPVSKRMLGGGGSSTLPPGGQLCAPPQLNIGIWSDDNDEGGKTISTKRPGSAGSTAQQPLHVRQDSIQIVPTSLVFNEYATTAIDEQRIEEEDLLEVKKTIHATSLKVMDETNSSKMPLGVRGVAKGGLVNTIGGGKLKGRYDLGRNKLVNKSTDSNETTSSDGNSFSSKSSSHSDSSAGKRHGTHHAPMSRQNPKRSLDHQTIVDLPSHRMNKVVGGTPMFLTQGRIPMQITDLSRTESMSSTCSTLPSRNHSFTYDGGEESSTYSHESMEIGDSVENLQVRLLLLITITCLIST